MLAAAEKQSLVALAACTGSVYVDASEVASRSVSQTFTPSQSSPRAVEPPVTSRKRARTPEAPTSANIVKQKKFPDVAAAMSRHYAIVGGLSKFFTLSATHSIVTLDRDRGTRFGAFLRFLKVTAPEVYILIGSPLYHKQQQAFFCNRVNWWPLNHCLWLLFPSSADDCTTAAKFVFNEFASTVDDGMQTDPIVLYQWPTEDVARGTDVKVSNRQGVVMH